MTDYILTKCKPYPYSSDIWTPETARDLRERLAESTVAPGHRAGLVVGPGTLPYTFDVLPSIIFVADRDKSIPHGIRERCGHIATCGSWAEYSNTHLTSASAKVEYRQAQNCGLAGAFEEVKTAASKANIISIIGDVVANAGRIATALNEAGQILTFINLTNVAEYLAPAPGAEEIGHHTARRGPAIMADMLETLPVACDAVICDSHGRYLEMALYTRQEYIGSFGSGTH